MLCCSLLCASHAKSLLYFSLKSMLILLWHGSVKDIQRYIPNKGMVDLSIACTLPTQLNRCFHTKIEHGMFSERKTVRERQRERHKREIGFVVKMRIVQHMPNAIVECFYVLIEYTPCAACIFLVYIPGSFSFSNQKNWMEFVWLGFSLQCNFNWIAGTKLVRRCLTVHTHTQKCMLFYTN